MAGEPGVAEGRISPNMCPSKNVFVDSDASEGSLFSPQGLFCLPFKFGSYRPWGPAAGGGGGGGVSQNVIS